MFTHRPGSCAPDRPPGPRARPWQSAMRNEITSGAEVVSEHLKATARGPSTTESVVDTPMSRLVAARRGRDRRRRSCRDPRLHTPHRTASRRPRDRPPRDPLRARRPQHHPAGVPRQPLPEACRGVILTRPTCGVSPGERVPRACRKPVRNAAAGIREQALPATPRRRADASTAQPHRSDAPRAPRPPPPRGRSALPPRSATAWLRTRDLPDACLGYRTGDGMSARPGPRCLHAEASTASPFHGGRPSGGSP
jgi:hypothetical protein